MIKKEFIQRSKTLKSSSGKTLIGAASKTSKMNCSISKPISPKKKCELKTQVTASKPQLLKSSVSLKTIKGGNSLEEDNGEFNLTESLSIISEIQHLFESSVDENKKPLEDIKRLLTTSLSLEEYLPLNAREREIIECDIAKSSDLRIENYGIAFKHIFNSLEKIQKTLNCLVEDNAKPLVTKAKAKRVLINEEVNKAYEDDDTDFCERVMTEKTAEHSLKSSLIQNDDFIQKLSKNKAKGSLLHTANSANSVPISEALSPLSKLSPANSKSELSSSLEYYDTFPDSIMALSKEKAIKKEECVIY